MIFESIPEYRSLKYMYGITIAANIGTLYTGFLFVAFNACGQEAEKEMGWDPLNDSLNVALIASAIPFGAIFGAIFAGYFGYKIGRRKVMIIADIICIIGVLMTMTNQIYVFIIGRILSGFSCGMNYNIIPLYVREMSPTEISGKTGGMFRIFWGVGMLLAFLEALTLPTGDDVNFLWKYIMVTPAIFAVIRLICFLFYIKYDTPKFYNIVGQSTEILAVLQLIYKPEYVTSASIVEKKSEKAQGIYEIIGPKFKKQLLICLFLDLIMQFTGINAVNFYSTKIFFHNDNNITTWGTRYFNVGFGGVRILGAIIGGLFVDKMGRKQLLILGSILTAFSAFLFSVAGLEDFIELQRCLLLVYCWIQSMTLELVLPIYSSELLPSTGIGLLVVFDCIWILIITFTFPFLAFTSQYAIYEIFGFYGFVGLISAPIMIIIVKETKNKTLHDIYKMFHSNRDSGLLDEDTSDDLDDGISIQKLTIDQFQPHEYSDIQTRICIFPHACMFSYITLYVEYCCLFYHYCGYSESFISLVFCIILISMEKDNFKCHFFYVQKKYYAYM